MPRTDAQKRADNKYKKSNSIVKTIRFYKRDKDMLDYVTSKGSFSGYVKHLIREDMEKSDA